MNTVGEKLGSDDQLVILADRIEQLHPKAGELGANGCLYLAQLSIATGAKVLPEESGEVRVWRDEDSGEMIVQFGIEFHNRIAWENGGYLMFRQPSKMNKEERDEYEVDDPADKGSICRLMKLADLKMLRDSGLITSEPHGITFREAINEMGYVGRAVVTQEEMKKKGRLPIGRTWQSVADRRAAKDALVKAFGMSAKSTPLIFHAPVQSSPANNDPIDDANDIFFS